MDDFDEDTAQLVADGIIPGITDPNDKRSIFLDGAAANGTSKRAAEDMWADIQVFSGYGFNKARTNFV